MKEGCKYDTFMLVTAGVCGVDLAEIDRRRFPLDSNYPISPYIDRANGIRAIASSCYRPVSLEPRGTVEEPACSHRILASTYLLNFLNRKRVSHTRHILQDAQVVRLFAR